MRIPNNNEVMHILREYGITIIIAIFMLMIFIRLLSDVYIKVKNVSLSQCTIQELSKLGTVASYHGSNFYVNHFNYYESLGAIELSLENKE